MSTSGDEPTAGPSGSSKQRRKMLKKPRVARACDFCRRRKIRCDGGQGPGGKCASCASANRECSYVQAFTEGPSGYVQALEYKQERMEALLRRLHPNDDFTPDVGIHITRDNWMLDGALGGQDTVESSPFALPPVTPSSPPSGSAPQSTYIRSVGHDPAVVLDQTIPADTGEDILAVKLDQLDNSFKSMHIASYIGSSGGPHAFKAAVNIAKESSLLLSRFPQFKMVRDKYWMLMPWERSVYETKLTAYDFPDMDLLSLLVEAYFQNVNILFPILHRPTFEKAIRIGLHLHQESFGAVVLLVCANGARYVQDKRVLLDGDSEDSWLSAGWKWYEQVAHGLTKKMLISTSRLHDLQAYCLAPLYVAGASRISSIWNMVGLGLRFAEEIGLHKKAVYPEVPTGESELFKRAFWVLLCLDRWVGSMLGRGFAIAGEDFDVDEPVDCDDEYWYPADPSQAFKQPPGKPSKMSYFISYIRLSRMSGLIVKVVYGSAKSKALFGQTGPEWQGQTLADFDSAFNKWADSVPEHLRWSPTREDDTFFWQSAHLFAYYYQLQMHLHRPFIVQSKKADLSFPSLAISVNAARSCSHILGIACDRKPSRICPFLLERAMAAGVILMLGIWGAKRSGMTMIPEKEMEDVHKCMRIHTHNEKHWHSAGRMWDILHTLITSAEMPLPNVDRQQQKRRLNQDEDSSSSANAVINTRTSGNQANNRPVAGSSRVYAAISQRATSLPTPPSSDGLSPPADSFTPPISGSALPASDFAISPQTTLPTSMSDLSQMSTNDLMTSLDPNALAWLSETSHHPPGTGETFQPPFVFGTGNEMAFTPLGLDDVPGSSYGLGGGELGGISMDFFRSMYNGYGSGSLDATSSDTTVPSNMHAQSDNGNEWERLLSQLQGSTPIPEG